ncbi:putative fungal chitosanase [Aspergillus steynii IBT 23096]|uniref:Endo-chitosanase n=1 Tax=Aspergillus steynii IBT 23096 TaxID=1392250 RepID=A0A2I2GFB6_9EURO|nr:putative fungal chitosanase [Aspergillus steynii IBT 23096]PLB51527.1 putative fungal chitosanase [Aspergillus steynii IBT 23096]
MHYATLAALLSAGLVSAYDVPDNLRQIYDNHKSGKCNNKLAGGFTDGISGESTFAYCGDIDGAIFLHSSGNGGQYDNMDVDCDGANNTGGDCANDPSGQGQTAFMDSLNQYGIDDLDANVHPYVVFGNSDFDPQEYGMEPLSVMAVVCGDQLFYGIWGDTNGADSTGEASISLAQLCYPDDGLTGDNGHGEDDVLYIGFTGKNAVPGDEADWTTDDTEAFEESIKELGDKLVAGLQD